MNELTLHPLATHAPETEKAAEEREAQIVRLRDAVLEKLTYSVGKDRNAASDRDWFVAVALAARDRIVNDWMVSVRGKDRFVVMEIEHYHYLRECELAAALAESQADLAAGRFVKESVDAHMKRLAKLA